jgi:hypothetical protein
MKLLEIIVDKRDDLYRAKDAFNKATRLCPNTLPKQRKLQALIFSGLGGTLIRRQY